MLEFQAEKAFLNGHKALAAAFAQAAGLYMIALLLTPVEVLQSND
jgi:hypothetical protein